MRRGLQAIRREGAATAPGPTPSEPEPAPQDDRLVLVLDEPLRQALAALRTSHARPDTPRENVAAARAAIRAMADTITEQARP